MTLGIHIRKILEDPEVIIAQEEYLQKFGKPRMFSPVGDVTKDGFIQNIRYEIETGSILSEHEMTRIVELEELDGRE